MFGGGGGGGKGLGVVSEGVLEEGQELLLCSWPEFCWGVAGIYQPVRGGMLPGGGGGGDGGGGGGGGGGGALNPKP